MKARIKMHQQPGDIPVFKKAAMLEGRDPRRKLAKSFKREHLKRERTVLRERTRKEVESQLATKDE